MTEFKKVHINQTQADAIKAVLYSHYPQDVIKNYCSDYREDCLPEPILNMNLDDLIRALYIGYEVEPTPEEKILSHYQEMKKDSEYGRLGGIEFVLDTLNIKIKGINE